MVDWLKHRADDEHGLGSKPTRAILLCLWERHFTALSPAWWSWQAVLNCNNISILSPAWWSSQAVLNCNNISNKLLADSNILAGRGNGLP